MLTPEAVGELTQTEQREPEFDVSVQGPPKIAAFSICSVEPRPLVFATQLAAAAPPPNSADHCHIFPVASITPHFDV